MKPGVLLTLLRGIEPIAEALLDRADLEFVTLYDITVPLLEQRGISCRRFNDFFPPEARVRAEREVARRAADIAREIYSPAVRNEWSRHDDASWAAIEKELIALLRRDLYDEIVLIDTLRRCADETDLRLVVVQQDICRDTKTLVYAARRLGIPSLHTLHGFPYGTTNAHDESFTDVIAVFSERAKAIYEGFGVPSDRIVVTGNPEWDLYSRPLPPGLRERACKALGLDPGRPIIVYGLTYVHRFSKVSALHPLYTHQTTDAVIGAFRALQRIHPEWQFVLRPHPNDPNAPRNLAELASEADLNPVWIDDKTSAASCLAMADVVVCIQSNLGVEAILLGKPVVNVVISEFGEPVFLEGMGPLFLDDDAVLFARAVEEIAPAVERAVLDEDTRRWFMDRRPLTIRRFNYLNDGRAGERLSAVALDMIRRKAHYVPAVARNPSFEQALARMVPHGLSKVLLLGRAAPQVADAVRDLCPLLDLECRAELPSDLGFHYSAVVFTAPLPHSAEAEVNLRAIRSLLKEDGIIIVPFQHGGSREAADQLAAGHWAPPRPGADATGPIGEYSWLGVEMVLSRSGFKPVAFTVLSSAPDGGLGAGKPDEGPVSRADTVGWVVRAVPRTKQLGTWGLARLTRRETAARMNVYGEWRYTQGDVLGAAATFTEALKIWTRSAPLHSNLGAALFALTRPEEAWDQFIEALHWDPAYEPAWDNLRETAKLLNRTEQMEQLSRLFAPSHQT